MTTSLRARLSFGRGNEVRDPLAGSHPIGTIRLKGYDKCGLAGSARRRQPVARWHHRVLTLF